MTRSKKAAILLVALVSAAFIIAVAINAQAEQQQQQQQDRIASNSTEPSREAATGAAGSGVAQSGVTSTVMYPMQQPGKTIQLRSMVQDVEVTGFVITADDQVKVSLAHEGAQKSPAVTVIVSTEWIPMPPYIGVAVPTSPSQAEPSAGGAVIEGGEPNTKPGYYPYPSPYPSLVGSNIVKGDWGSAAEIKLGLVGNGTIYDATSIQVLIIPYTGNP